MILPSDRPMLELLDRIEIANSILIDRLSYNDYKTTSRRLKKLCEDKVIYRTRDVDTKGYVYGMKPFVKTPSQLKQLRHKNKRNELYMMMLDDPNVQVVAAYREQPILEFRADLVVEVMYKGEHIDFIIEIETGSKKADLSKYNQMYYTGEWKRLFDNKPIVVWVMDQVPKEKSIYYPYKWIRWDLENYSELWE